MHRMADALFEARYDEAFQAARTLRERDGEQTAPAVLYAGVCALFGLGHILQAEEWLEEHGRRSHYRAEHLYLAAYVELHKERPERALLYWTRIVQEDPAETFADSLIEKLKRGSDRVRLDLNHAGAFLRYVPLDPVERGLRASRRTRTQPAGWFTRLLQRFSPAAPSTDGAVVSRDRFWWVFAGIIMLTGVSVAFAAYLDDIARVFAPDPYSAAEETLPDVPLNGTVISPAEYSEDAPRFVYADKAEALQEFRTARERIAGGLPNQGRYLLGRLELSNASFEIKERARLLRDSIPRVSADQFRDPVDVRSVLEEPYIFRDAQVLWNGTVRNLAKAEGGLRFDLEVSGSGAGDRLPVSVLYLYSGTGGPDREPVENQNIEVFGTVVKATGQRLTVQAVSLR